MNCLAMLLTDSGISGKVVIFAANYKSVLRTPFELLFWMIGVA
jgi:hypothetical protein